MSKNLKDLPQDIDLLFSNGTIINEENLKVFLDNVGELMRDRLARNLEDKKAKTLRMSKLGLPDRKLWFEYNTEIEEAPAKNALKFIYGDIVEQLVLLLAKEAGHLVENEQQEVVIDGIVGHQDAKIDGVTVDVKSASSFAFRKFSEGYLTRDDPFGYVAQLSAYMHADNNDKGAFLAVNKENGEIVVLPLEPIDTVHPPSRIEHLKQLIQQDAPPVEKCYPEKDFGASGNKVLDKNCGYCPFKHLCWKDANNGQGLRMFNYANGVTYFTSVVNTPRVEEVFNTFKPEDEE